MLLLTCISLLTSNYLILTSFSLSDCFQILLMVFFVLYSLLRSLLSLHSSLVLALSPPLLLSELDVRALLFTSNTESTTKNFGITLLRKMFTQSGTQANLVLPRTSTLSKPSTETLLMLLESTLVKSGTRILCVERLASPL